jgi:hypothetical protein
MRITPERFAWRGRAPAWRDLALLVLAAGLAIPGSAALGSSGPIELPLRSRDPNTGQPRVKMLKLDPAKVGIVIVDMWNYHWCMTWTHRVESLVPHMNAALTGARKLGMQVFWAPTDAASMYAGAPQRESALAVPHHPMAKVRDCPLPSTVRMAPCLCGPGTPCQVNYGLDAMDPDLVVAGQDLIIGGGEELFSLCKERGITRLIYMGGAINICLGGKSEGLRRMVEAGLDCVLARDLCEAMSIYDPASGYSPDTGTEQAVADVERAGVPSADMGDVLRRAGQWPTLTLVDAVRIAPWGKPGRPYLFREPTVVTLSAPHLKGAEIRCTLDGKQPTTSSRIYDGPLTLSNSVTLRAAAFDRGRRVSLVSEASFIRLPPQPPKPDLYAEQVTPVPVFEAWVDRHIPAFQFPVSVGHAFTGEALRVCGQHYDRGLGMRAPAGLLFEVKPEYNRFVALAAIDENVLARNLGALLAQEPSLRFQVFIDGRLAAESPVLKISQGPWPFDVVIPEGTRIIHLVANDGGKRSALNLADWVEAGFVLKK